MHSGTQFKKWMILRFELKSQIYIFCNHIYLAKAVHFHSATKKTHPWTQALLGDINLFSVRFDIT